MVIFCSNNSSSCGSNKEICSLLLVVNTYIDYSSSNLFSITPNISITSCVSSRKYWDEYGLFESITMYYILYVGLQTVLQFISVAAGYKQNNAVHCKMSWMVDV